MIHTTVGVYSNFSFKSNGVPSEDLARHIAYNINFRPGRALFIDGICVYAGYLTDEGVTKATEKIINIKVKIDTKPYV